MNDKSCAFVDSGNNVSTINCSEVTAEVLQSFIRSKTHENFEFSHHDEFLFQDVSSELETMWPSNRLKDCRLFIHSKSFGCLLLKAGRPANEIVAVSSTNGKSFIRHTKKTLITSFMTSVFQVDHVSWTLLFFWMAFMIYFFLYSLIPIARHLELKLDISGMLLANASVIKNETYIL